MPRVLNIKLATKEEMENGVLIDRTTKWGNPFHIHQHGNRAQVIHKHRIWFVNSPLYKDLEELKGKDLICHCAPLACHGDTYLELAND